MPDLVWSETAARNLDDIAEYIAQDNPEAAERIVMRVMERVSGLAFHPLQGRPGRVEDTRELVIYGTSYIAVYRVRERVEVLRIRHSSQKWPETS